MNSIAEELTLSPTQTINNYSNHEASTDPTPLTDISVLIPSHNNKSTETTDLLPQPSEIITSIPSSTVQHNHQTTIRLLQYAAHDPYTNDVIIQMHVDGGANRSITNDSALLIHFRNIKPYTISGVNAEDSGVSCTGLGYLPWKTPDGDVLLVKCYYSASASDTIISPSDVVLNHISDFEAWTHHANLVTGKGYIDFIKRGTNNERIHFPLYTENGLWFYRQHTMMDFTPTYSRAKHLPLVNRLTTRGQYELIHARLGHPGTKVMENLHQHLDGIPKLRVPPLYRCHTCMLMKSTKRAITTNDVTKCIMDFKHQIEALGTPVNQSIMSDEPIMNVIDTGIRNHPTCLPTKADLDTMDKTCSPGERFHMDMGFVRGTKYSIKDADGSMITSLDGYNSYLLIIDRATRYIWIFLTKNKTPQVKVIKNFLQIHGAKSNTQKYVRTDLGGELYGSHDFQKAIEEAGYILQPTASDASFQNGVAERPNRTLADMIRCLLHGANLGPEYWSWALIHAVYLKNRLPHRAINTTPYQAYTGHKPNARKLRIFGCPVVSRLPGRRPAKLDAHVATGIFLGYTATDNNIYYRDNLTHRIKIAMHVTFDEAGYTIPQKEQSLMQQNLQAMGVQHQDLEPESPCEITDDHDHFFIQRLSPNATIPTRASSEATGYDLYSATDIVLPPGSLIKVPTDIAIQPQHGTYGQILPRSGLLVNHNIETKAGTIDRDYTGNIQVVLKNNADGPFTITKGDRIAQLILYNIAHPTIQETDTLHSTDRGDSGFGSTGMAPQITLANATTSIYDDLIHMDGIKPYNIWLSTDPFQHRLTITIDVKGDHPTLGLVLGTSHHQGRMQLVDIIKGTAASRLPRWRSTIKRAILLSCNGNPVTSEDDLRAEIVQARHLGLLKLQCEFATVSRHAIHPQEGSLTLYYDQLNIIAKHLKEAYPRPCVHQLNADEPASTDHVACNGQPNLDIGKSFTLKELKKRADWSEWRQARYEMLDNYKNQGMFGAPQERPKGANVHHMLWRYLIKHDGRRKARMVCDGSPRQGTITLGHTYANSVDSASERLFWAIVAQNGLIAYGADVSNAFAEAPAPVAPLYMLIDEAYRDWWENHLKLPPIPKEHTVVRVNHAIQGHPESPRLWEKMIDKILKQLGFTASTHEPCLYKAICDGKLALFLRQVDDFAIATPDRETADMIIGQIDKHLHLPIHNLGIVDRYNGIDIIQTKYYVKLHCSKYLHKMLQGHGWLPRDTTSHPKLPFPSDKNYLKQLQDASPPTTEQGQQELEQKMGFKYRQLMGELLYPMVKCRPDISTHTILLSQYSNNPAEIHYNALKSIAQYLAATINDGIYYWRRAPHPNLPAAPLPIPRADNYTLKEQRGTNSDALIGYVDSDWAAHTTKRTSLTGIILMYAGGVVGYKTKFQPVIAHSTTEAEFVAACDAAKMILFYRSIMEDMDIPQDHATVLFEDNN